MKNKLLISLYFLSIVAACSKLNNSTSIGSVIYSLRVDSATAPADGTSLIHVSVQLDSMATSDRLGVLFKINTGNFPGGPATAVDTAEVVQAQFIGKSLVAKAVIQVPQLPGLLIISAQPSVPTVTDYNQYILLDTVKLLPSVPDTLILTTSSIGIASNYGSQVTITGSLYNSAKGKVSFGYKVSFADSLAGPAPAGGNWTSVVDTTNALSQVSAVYSFGPGSVGTPIYLTCSLMDSTGAKIQPVGKATIYINK
jgi:hypothetical protein